MNNKLDMVELIENSPIITINDNNKLLSKIQTYFTDFEQQLFISSFYCYLNYDKGADFLVDLDNVWKWLGFSSKQNAIKLLERFFKIEEDYKEFLLNLVDKQDVKLGEVRNSVINQDSQHGGHNKKKYMLNIRCFKSLCLKAQTKKASQIHEYYIKMEELLQEVVDVLGAVAPQMSPHLPALIIL